MLVEPTIIGSRGANFGRPMTEGPIDPPQPGLRGPLYAYPSGVITGGAFYTAQSPRFPSELVGRYFFGDYTQGRIKVLNPDNGTVADFATGASNLVDVVVKRDGTLWYLQRGGSPAGQLHRIRYTVDEPPMIEADPPRTKKVSVNRVASLQVQAVGGAPLSYQWQKNGANVPTGTSATLTFVAQLADDGALYRCVVSNPFGTAITITTKLVLLPSPAAASEDSAQGD